MNADGLRTRLRAQDIVSQFEALGSAARAEDLTGSLKVVAIASVQATVLAQALAAFRTSCPFCHVHLEPGASPDLLDRVDAKKLDVAVLIRPPFDLPADLHWRSLLREDYGLLAPQSVEGDDGRAIVSNAPFSRHDRSSFGGRQVERLLREAWLRPNAG